MRARFRHLLIFTLSLCATIASCARPIIEFHALGNAGNDAPVWSIASLPDGTTLLGSNQLLAQWDDESVSALPVEGLWAIRSLAPASDPTDGARVYAGGDGDLGYFDQNDDGSWSWHSLRGEFERASELALDEVWLVRSTSDGVAFITSQQAAWWNGKNMSVWPMRTEPRLVPLTAAGAVLAYRAGEGIIAIEANGPRTVITDAELPARPVAWVALPAGKFDPRDLGTVLGTANGVFVRQTSDWSKLERVSAALATSTATAAQLRGSTLAVGTLQGGIALIDPTADEILARIDRDHGLPDDSVQTLQWDTDGSLLVGLKTGYARIRGWGQSELLDRTEGVVGPVQDIVTDGEDVFAVSHRAVQAVKMSSGATVMRTVATEVQMLIADSAVMDGNLFVSGFGGIWRRPAAGGAWVREYVSETDVTPLAPSRHRPSWLFFVEGTRLLALEARTEAAKRTAENEIMADGSAWIPRQLAANLGDAPVDMQEAADGTLWVTTLRGFAHAYRLEETLDGGFRLQYRSSFPQGNRTGKRGLADPHLDSIGDVLCLISTSGVFSLDSAGLFQRRTELDDWSITSVAGDEDATYALVRNRAHASGHVLIARLEWSSDKTRLHVMPLAAPGMQEIATAEKLFLTRTASRSSPDLWVTSATGLFRVAANSLEPLPPAPRIAWREIAGGGVRLSLESPALDLPAGNRRLGFRFSAAARTAGLSYQNYLSPVESGWSKSSTSGEREFTALAPGDYEFVVRTVDAAGRPGPESRRAFTIAAPWWRTWFALGAYAAALAALAVGAHRWRLARVERQNERLNSLVEERTRELAMANAAKTEFLENISHEIRNPLNGVIGLVGMLHDASLDNRGRALAGSLAACARTLGRVFDSVLGFARLEAGQVQLQNVVFSPAAMLEEIRGVFAATAAQRACRIEYRCDDSLPAAVRGDEEKLRTIVSNFVSNALKYAAGAPVLVTCSTEPVAKNRVELTINVTDFGPGVPSEEQELIFRKFVRGTAARNQAVAGSGLGLAASRALAQLIGGFIGVESPVDVSSAQRPGQGGATFYVRAAFDLADPADLPASRSNEEITRIAAPGERMLIVEDEEYNQIVSSRMAERLGYQPMVVTDAPAALRELATHAYPVLLVDWELSAGKGSDVARGARRLKNGHVPIIIAATAHDSDAVRRECLDAGMDAFVVKPLDASVIAQHILLHRANRSVTAATGSDRLSPLDARAFTLIAGETHGSAEDAARAWIQALDRHLEALRKNIAGENFIQAARFAHKLRAHGGLVGATAFVRAAAALESTLKSDRADAPQSTNLLGALENQAADVRDLVARWLERDTEPATREIRS